MKTLRERKEKKKKKKKGIVREITETFSMYDNDNEANAVVLQQGLLFFCSLLRLFFLFSASVCPSGSQTSSYRSVTFLAWWSTSLSLSYWTTFEIRSGYLAITRITCSRTYAIVLHFVPYFVASIIILTFSKFCTYSCFFNWLARCVEISTWKGFTKSEKR